MQSSPVAGPARSGTALLSPADKIRGVCFVAGRTLPEDPFGPIRAVGAEWISQTPFAWQGASDTPSLRMATSGRIYWGETDEGLKETAKKAREAGLKTLINPHVWLRDHGTWRGTIAMKSEEDWKLWFSQYREMILHYAGIARDDKVEALAIGTELAATTHREVDWRALIAEVRKVYPGVLTYAANWDEVERVGFWDALDWIGVQAYYPVAEAAGVSRDQVAAAWAKRAEALEALSRRSGRPIVFTEAGYRSQRGSLVEPWIWRDDGPVDLEEQARGYAGLFDALWTRPWFGGLFVWKWFPDHQRAGGPDDAGFTPQRKPAEEIIRKWFLATP